MDAFGSISAFPVRHYMAATAVQAKGLDQLVNDPGAALRRLGEISLNEQTRATERSEKVPPVPVATNRSLSGRLLRQSLEEARDGAQTPARGERAGASSNANEANVANSGDERPAQLGRLSPEEQDVVDQLKARDREVRAHEQAHKNVGGRYAGAISYDYQRGPDGQQYAVGGSVPIDVSPEATPEATVAKMRVVIAAALAPAEPSPADRAVAATAQSQLVQASAEARAEDQAEMLARLEGDGHNAENESSGVANFMAVEDQESPYNILGLIDRAA